MPTDDGSESDAPPFIKDLRPKNRDASQANEVAVSFAKFLNTMWNKADVGEGSYAWQKDVHSPAYLKRAIARRNCLFEGTSQHDTYELLQTLLDTVHEDVNIAELAGQGQLVVMPSDHLLHSYPDEMVETLFREKYLKCNRSIISDLMVGETRSEIKCANCKTVSRKLWHFLVMAVDVNKGGDGHTPLLGGNTSNDDQAAFPVLSGLDRLGANTASTGDGDGTPRNRYTGGLDTIAEDAQIDTGGAWDDGPTITTTHWSSSY